jgi:hypothetical protein
MSNHAALSHKEETPRKSENGYIVFAMFLLFVVGLFNCVLVALRTDINIQIFLNFLISTPFALFATAFYEGLQKKLILWLFRIYKRFVRAGLVEELNAE